MTGEAATYTKIVMAVLCMAGTARAQDAPPDGAAVFARQCGTCHSRVAGENRQGPNLAGVFGRKAGTVPGYNYSPGFKDADFAWDEAHLDPYLANPQSVITGGVMGYRQRNPDVRAQIIAYLKENQ